MWLALTSIDPLIDCVLHGLMAQFRRKRPKNHEIAIHLRMPMDMVMAIDEMAETHGFTRSKAIRVLIREGLLGVSPTPTILKAINVTKPRV